MIEDAGSAACVLIAPAPLPAVVGTTPFKMVSVFAEPSLFVLVFGADCPVASPPSETFSVSVEEVLTVSPVTATGEPPAEVVGSGIPSVAEVAPGARCSTSLLELDTRFAATGSTDDGEPAIEVIADGTSAAPDGELD